MSPTNRTTSGRTQRTTLLVGIVLVILVLVGVLLWDGRNSPYVATFLGSNVATTTSNGGTKQVGQATYTCDGGKTITATFFDLKNPPTQLPDVMPTPTGSIFLVLSDGRSMTLPQTISGSGVRYANADESLVFWNKGNTAFIEEGASQNQTYTGCISASALPGVENWGTFASSTMGISVRYPSEYGVQLGYTYTQRGPDQAPISGVKFTIPSALYQGTNLSGFDTGVSIEQLPQNTTCSPNDFLSASSTEKTVTDGGVTYQVAHLSDAGAGNFYDETVYAIQGSSVCTAVRYFIHSTNIGNYTSGTVKEFDKAALLAQFDKIRESIVLGL